MNKIPMTVNGYENLQTELKKLLNEERPNIIEAIAEARSHGDLSENAEYQYAKEQQSLIEGKILDLESAISRAEVIDVKSLEGDDIKFGATVEIEDDDTGEIVSEIYYQIDENCQWGELTANPEGLIFPIFSYMSPDFTFEWIADTGLGLYANLSDLEYSFEPLESGVGFTAELWIFDFGGNSDYVTVSDIVP